MSNLFDGIDDAPTPPPIDPDDEPQSSRTVAWVMYWVRRYPGSTARELDRYAQSAVGAVRKCLDDLERRGRVAAGATRICEVTGRMAPSWWPADANGNPTPSAEE